jgi:hypothetical protein
MKLFFLLALLCISSFSNAFVGFRPQAFARRSSIAGESNIKLNLIGGIAEKMGGIVEFVSGQQKITEANIEDTLKVAI